MKDRRVATPELAWQGMDNSAKCGHCQRVIIWVHNPELRVGEWVHSGNDKARCS